MSSLIDIWIYYVYEEESNEILFVKIYNETKIDQESLIASTFLPWSTDCLPMVGSHAAAIVGVLSYVSRHGVVVRAAFHHGLYRDKTYGTEGKKVKRGENVCVSIHT